MGIEKQLFTCKRDDLTIKGMQYFPADYEENKKYPAMIMSHGFTGNYTDSMVFCEEFAKMGYAAFCFSFCGGTATDTDESVKSEGKTTEMSVLTEVEDLLAVKNYVQSQSFVDEKRISLMGFSQGGFVSGLTAARCGDEIEKLIMIYPALCIPDDARGGRLAGASYDAKAVPDIIDCGNILISKKYHDDIVEMDPYLELSAYQGPVLLIQGMNDEIVNFSYAIRAKESYKAGQCHLQLVREMGHGFDANQQSSLIASIKQYLLGCEEILTIRVIITRIESVVEDDIFKNDVYFTGYCDNKYFRGAITPEGCDKQEYQGGVQTKIRAEYTLTGVDMDGKVCSIHIVNQKDGDKWKPVIETGSEALAWLNGADLTAVLEGEKGGLTVRIYAEK